VNQYRNERPIREDLRSLRVSQVADIHQAVAWTQRLLQEIRKIQTQMKMPNRCNARGQRLTVAEYRSWRSNALFALQSLEQQRRELRTYIRQERARLKEEAIPAHARDAESLLLSLYRVNRAVLSQAQDLKLSDQDQTLLDVIRDRFFLFDL